MPSPPTPRTTPTLVDGIVDVQAGFDLTPMIAVANQLTTQFCTYGPGTSSARIPPYTDGFVGSQMELIERWLAAHCYKVYDNALANARAGSVAVGYQFKIDMGLLQTQYGATAMLLDIGGNLSRWSNSLSARKRTKIWIVGPGRLPHWPGDVDSWQELLTICQ